MLKKILIPLLAIASIWLFAFGLPAYILSGYTTFVAITGSVVCTALLAYAAFLLYPPYTGDDHAERDQHNTLGCVIMVFLGLFFFGYTFFIISRATDAEAEEYTKNGLFTMGTIVDGSSVETRRADFTHVVVNYKNEKGEDHSANVDVTSSEFQSYAKGQPVPIIYSRLHPSMVRILHNAEEINKYFKKEIRPVKVADLIKIADLPRGEETVNYLNSFSLLWEYTPYGLKGGSYTDNINKVGIRVEPEENLVSYVTKGIKPGLFAEELKSLGFTESEIAGKRVMVKDNLLILSQIKTSMPGSDDSPYGMPEQTTIISLYKK